MLTLNKFIEKEEVIMNNDIIENIAKFASVTTQSKLYMTNKFLNKIIVEEVPENRGKQNYIYFIKALHSLKNIEKHNVPRFTLYCRDQNNFKENLECIAYYNNEYQLISFSLVSERNPRKKLIEDYDFSELDNFDIFKHIKSKKYLKSFIYTMKHLRSVFVPFGGSLENDWNKFNKSGI